jgi:hypothetical protein
VIYRLRLVVLLLLAQVGVVGAGAGAGRLELQFPTKPHLTALKLYQLGNPGQAIEEVIGQFVLLEVVVTIEREVPVVEIVVPKELAREAGAATRAIQAHLISATTVASSRKKGERLLIEGVIVAEGYGAYTIYLHQAQLIR